MSEHDATDCLPHCNVCLNNEGRESIVRLEAALLDLETSMEGAEGMWVDLPMTVDALDIRNVLDLVRGA
jgi:hypothetical protein